MQSIVIGWIRTAVPWAVGAALAAGLLPDGLSEAATLVGTVALTSAYYLVGRALESRWPALGWLLGAPKAPSYS